MKLTSIDFGFNTMGYPVGLNMKDAVDYINKVGEVINLPCSKSTEIAIWCRGSSGAILASLLLVKLTGGLGYSSVYIYHVKKPGESSHNIKHVCDSEYHIVIDDFISSGETIRAIAMEMWQSKIEFIDCLIVHSVGFYYDKHDKVRLKVPTPKMLITKDYNNTINSDLKKLRRSNLKTYTYDNEE